MSPLGHLNVDLIVELDGGSPFLLFSPKSDVALQNLNKKSPKTT